MRVRLEWKPAYWLFGWCYVKRIRTFYVCVPMLSLGFVFAKDHRVLSAFSRLRRPTLGEVMVMVLITQLGHFTEHAIQVGQIVSGVPAPQAKAILGQIFDAEWFHFLFNTYLLSMVILFLTRNPRNPWLWVGLMAGILHECEHLYLIHNYIVSHKALQPGLIGKGGALGILTDVTRPWVHFGYNFIETAPLIMAVCHQAKRPRFMHRAYWTQRAAVQAFSS